MWPQVDGTKAVDSFLYGNNFGLRPGSWSIGNLRLPEFGVTEARANSISGGQTSDLSSAVKSSFANEGSTLGQSTYDYSQAKSPVNSSPFKPTTTNPTNNPTPSPSNSGRQTISEQDALRMGLDWNNLPGQYARNDQQGGGDPYAGVRSAIDSKYNNYFGVLDSMMSDLPAQQGIQSGIVQNQFDAGVNTLNTQKDQGLADLGLERGKNEANQKKTLQSIYDNIGQLFQSGNNMLGVRGASDSSAANQYAYALSKQGNKQRGDVLAQTNQINNEISNREFKLKSTYDNELVNMQKERDSKIGEISQWFYDSLNQIRSQRANGELNKGEDLRSLAETKLSQALGEINRINSEVSNRKSMLEQWAIEQSNTIGQLKNNLRSVSEFQAEAPTYNAFGLSDVNFGGGTSNLPMYFGTGDQEKEKLA